MDESPLEWHGHVTDVDGDMFTAEIKRDGEPGLYADFSMNECGLSGIEPGDIIVVTPESVKLVDLGVWTQQDLDEIRERARVRWAQIEQCVE